MMHISFGHTTPALVTGNKTVTRRDWKPRHAAHFKAGMVCGALNTDQARRRAEGGRDTPDRRSQTRWAARVPPRSVRSLRVLDDRIGASMSAADAIRTAIAALESERRAVERDRDHAADMAQRCRQAVALPGARARLLSG